MAPARKVKGQKPSRPTERGLKRKRDEEDIATLTQKIADLDPKSKLDSFTDLPLSTATSSGLSSSHFKALTDIQSRAVPYALQGRDILGAAKTGSGKTLAFLVPVLENLYRKQWTELDGLGALILSPTRELAIQIFEVLRKVGRYHSFSAGLVIGGKSLQEEQERLGRMNILVCTPGRMLQHLDQTAAFEIDNLQMLVLDEADRILDMGFQGTVDAIVEHLPKERQTMLFSATQTKKVSDLARLSLQDPEYVAVHESASSATPSTLQQHYIVTSLPDKLDTLWSFIRSNLKAKILVFLSSGKQVRFVYEGLRHLQPGISLLHLHGRQKQGARLDITKKFSSAQHACLFATDVAARGLDFPAVDWVIQHDCPEDADTYIHRVGRTARYERDGRAVLFLEPSEEKGMMERLSHKKIPIEKINVRAKKQQSVKSQLQNMCFKDPELKYLGQKAFISYVRSVHVQKDKEVFKIKDLPLEEYAASLGLPGAPRIKFVKGEDAKTKKNAPRRKEMLSSDEGSDEDDDKDKEKKAKKDTVRTKYDRMFERRNQDVLADHYSKLIHEEDGTTAAGAINPNSTTADANEDDDFLSVKRRFDAGDEELGAVSDDSTAPAKKSVPINSKEALIIDSKRREKLLASKKKLLKFKSKGTKTIYDSDGNPHDVYEMEDEEDFRKKGTADEQRRKFLELEAERARLADVKDKEISKQKKREKKEKKKRARERERMGISEDEEDGGVAVLAPYDEGDVDMGENDEAEDDTRPNKRPKKWFEESKRSKSTKDDAVGGIQTLGDLEALASGLLQ